MKTRQIKFVVEAIKWFDKVNGNTYHSCQITRIDDGAVLCCQFQYGYGEQYRYTALEKMAESGWLPDKYSETDLNKRGIKNCLDYERENNYPIKWIVSDGLKREAVALGKEN